MYIAVSSTQVSNLETKIGGPLWGQFAEWRSARRNLLLKRTQYMSLLLEHQACATRATSQNYPC